MNWWLYPKKPQWILKINLTDGLNSMNQKSRSYKWQWGLVYSLIFLVVAWVIIKGIVPAYKSPHSRLYASSLGYPALLRKFGLTIPVEVIHPQQKDFSQPISGVGKLEYYRKIPVYAPESGVVSHVYKGLGDEVLMGDVLLDIHSGDHRAVIAKLDMALKKKELEKAEQDLQREQEAYSRGVTSLADFDAVKIQHQRALLQYRKAQEDYNESLFSLSARFDLSHANKTITNHTTAEEADVDVADVDEKEAGQLEVIATVSGRLLESNVISGQALLNGGRSALMIIGDRLMFSAEFDQRYLTRVALKDPAVVRLETFPGREFSAVVEFIEQQVKETMQGIDTFTVWFELDNTESISHMVSGMSGFVLIEKVLPRLALPESAVMRYTGIQGMILTVNNQHLQAHPIHYDIRENGWLGITQGISSGDPVVLSGQVGLHEGDRVEIQNED